MYLVPSFSSLFLVSRFHQSKLLVIVDIYDHRHCVDDVLRTSYTSITRTGAGSRQATCLGMHVVKVMHLMLPAYPTSPPLPLIFLCNRLLPSGVSPSSTYFTAISTNNITAYITNDNRVTNTQKVGRRYDKLIPV